MRTRGAPHPKLTGRVPVSSPESSWWDQVMSELMSRDGMVGRTLSIEELTESIPCYPGGGRPRGRTVARRLHRVLELMERGPNGSLGRGATYRIVGHIRALPAGRQDVRDETVEPADAWLLDAVKRMTTGEE